VGRGRRIFVQERLGRHDLARRTDSALEAAVLDEGLLDGMECLALCQALDGRDLSPVVLNGQREAGAEHLSIDDDRASAAYADAAALFSTGQAEVIPKQVDE